MTQHTEPRDAVRIPAGLAKIIVAYAHGGADLPKLEFSPLRRLKGFRGTPSDASCGVIAACEGGEAALRLSGRFEEQDGDVLEAELIDGSTIRAEHVLVTNEQTSLSKHHPPKLTTDLQVTEWQWSTAEQPIAWVAALRGVHFGHAYNLAIKGHGRRSFKSLRLEGNAAWHLTHPGAFGEHSCVAIIDTSGVDLARGRLWHDFAALEFLFGTALRLDLLIGVNAKNEPVAAYGASFGYRYRSRPNREPPLPDDRNSTWLAVAFPLVARSLEEAQPNPVTIAACGYVDSTVGHIDGQYLFAQVALEALAYRLTPEGKPLVKDVAAWKTWVKSLRDALKEHAFDAQALNVLAVKLRDASRPTTSSLVQQTLSRMGIAAPEEALAEVDGRNVVAHTLSMTDGEPYDIERDVRRVRMIRSLLAALVLRHLGYEGALAGWDLDERGDRKLAEWFPVSEGATAEARRLHEAIVDDPQPNMGPLPR
ncbi:MAG: uncharacterized protein JWP97_5374 [Labilithrix sp.]|nr:uncharacterized protein [Labilithrix sp.]